MTVPEALLDILDPYVYVHPDPDESSPQPEEDQAWYVQLRSGRFVKYLEHTPLGGLEHYAGVGWHSNAVLGTVYFQIKPYAYGRAVVVDLPKGARDCILPFNSHDMHVTVAFCEERCKYPVSQIVDAIQDHWSVGTIIECIAWTEVAGGPGSILLYPLTGHLPALTQYTLSGFPRTQRPHQTMGNETVAPYHSAINPIYYYKEASGTYYQFYHNEWQDGGLPRQVDAATQTETETAAPTNT